MPTARPRVLVTETDELGRALHGDHPRLRGLFPPGTTDALRDQWPE